MITGEGSDELGMEVKSLYNEVMSLKVAIEEAIIKGQKSLAGVADIPEANSFSNKRSALTRVSAYDGVVGWVDDF